MYEYKTVPVTQYLTCKKGLNLSQTLASYIQDIINEMSQEGWEYYRSDNFTICESPGCLDSLFGGKVRYGNFNILVFRREQK